MSALADTMLGSGADKAAIMMLLLPEDDAAQLLSHLSPEELRDLSARMCALGEIAPNQIVDAIAGFSDATPDGGIQDHGRVDTVRRMLNTAVGEIKTDNVMRSVVVEEEAPQPEPSSALGMLRWLNPDVIAQLLVEEHPQVAKHRSALALTQTDLALAYRSLGCSQKAEAARLCIRHSKLDFARFERVLVGQKLRVRRLP